ncbi:MAG: hypothetical protein L0Y72_03575 [Gemmataceae bacterium]|nr:hypothetical protein [Gemmataceae bacterium]MCI0738098.1 hypothetical protein [Gemmataceae bacterium]
MRQLIGMIVLAGLASAAPAQLAEKHDARAVQTSLKDVINTGADLFNKHGDHAGCYRVYQGALVAVKPFLAAALQKEIDDGIAAAEKLPRMSDRCFALRRVLDAIRSQAKDDAAAAEDPGKATAEKKGNLAEPGGVKAQDATGKLEGIVTYKGQPLTQIYITLVSEDNRRFSTYVREEGKYVFKTMLPVGMYRIYFEAGPGTNLKLKLPERYHSASTSGLTIELKTGKQSFDVQLQ